MASRNFKVGTVYSRISGLLKAGVVRHKPLWFDVVEAFPPVTATQYNRAPLPGRMMKLEYWEDDVREKFYKQFGRTEATNLFESNSTMTVCDRFIRCYAQLTAQGINDDKAFYMAKDTLEKEGVDLQPRKKNRENITVNDKTTREDYDDDVFPI